VVSAFQGTSVEDGGVRAGAIRVTTDRAVEKFKRNLGKVESRGESAAAAAAAKGKDGVDSGQGARSAAPFAPSTAAAAARARAALRDRDTAAAEAKEAEHAAEARVGWLTRLTRRSTPAPAEPQFHSINDDYNKTFRESFLTYDAFTPGAAPPVVKGWRLYKSKLARTKLAKLKAAEEAGGIQTGVAKKSILMSKWSAVTTGSSADARLMERLVESHNRRNAEYEVAMDDGLPAVTPKLDYDEAKAEWNDQAVTDLNGRAIPVWRSNLTDIENLGTGIGLWFRTLRSMAIYFTVMSIPMGAMLTHYLYLFYNPASDLDGDTMSSMAQVTTGVVATTNQDDTIGGWNVKTVMLTVSSLDSLTIVIFLFLVLDLRRRQDQYIAENDDAIISLPDYTVEVWGIPEDATEAEVTTHFRQFGRLADCVVVQDRGKVMGFRIRRYKLLEKLISMKLKASYYAGKGKASRLKAQMKRIAKQKKAVIKCDQIIDKKIGNGFASVCAFVTFERQNDRVDAAAEYRRGTYLSGCFQSESLKFRGKHMLRLNRAPDASDVLWENVLRIRTVVRIARKLLSLLCIFMLLMGAISFVVFAKSSLANAPPTVSCSTTRADPIENPTPLLECDAIWPLYNQSAQTNVSSHARQSVDMFVANVDADQCRKFIVRKKWAMPMGEFAPYEGARLANLPRVNESWAGGWIKDTQADECAALACKRCYCTSIVSFNNVVELMSATSNDKVKAGFCSDIFDQIFADASIQFGTIIVTSVTNMVLMASAGFFSRFERHRTVSATEANAALYTFFALFVNQTLVPVIIYSLIEILDGFPIFFQGNFTDFDEGWYNKVMVLLLGLAVVNMFAFPLARTAPAVVSRLKRACFSRSAHSQRKLNHLYKPLKFILAERYGQVLCALFYTIVFSFAAPPLFPIAAVLFTLMYLVDKTLLLQCSRKPPAYDQKLNSMFLAYAPYACWIHFAAATWAFGHHTIPSYIVDPGDAVPASKSGYYQDAVADAAARSNSTGAGGLYTGAPDQFDFLSRLVRVNAVIPFSLFLLLTVSLFLWEFAEFVGEVFSGIYRTCCGADVEVENMPPFSALAHPGDSRFDDPATDAKMKLSGLRSYRIEDNPEYMMLFPEVLDIQAGKSRRLT